MSVSDMIVDAGVHFKSKCLTALDCLQEEKFMFIRPEMSSSVMGMSNASAPQPTEQTRTIDKAESELLKANNVFVNEGENIDCDKEGADKLNSLLQHLKQGNLTDDDKLTLAAMQDAFKDPSSFSATAPSMSSAEQNIDLSKSGCLSG